MTSEQELKELRNKITECWYLAYPESMRTPDKDDNAALQRIFNLYQDLKDTRFNYRVLHKAYNEMDKERKK